MVKRVCKYCEIIFESEFKKGKVCRACKIKNRNNCIYRYYINKFGKKEKK